MEEASLLKSNKLFQDHYQVIREKLGGGGADAEEPQAEPAPEKADGFEIEPGADPASLPDAARKVWETVAPPSGKVPDRSGYLGESRNPFAPTRQVATARRGGLPGELTLQPLQNAVKLPKMRLRGVVNDGANQLAALLELEGIGVYVVREGDTVGLYEAGSNHVIQIQKINRLNLLVKAGSVGQIIVVR